MALSLTQTLKQAARFRGDEGGVFVGDRRLSYPQLVERASRLAAALQANGVKPGDRVGLLALNSEHYVVVMFAAWWAGAVINPVNIRWSAPEVVFSLQDSGTEVLFIDRAFAPMVPALREQVGGLRLLVGLDDAPGTDALYAQWVDDHAPVPDAGRSGDDLAGLFYTGGTTGRPKGVMLSHQAMVINLWISMVEIGIAEDDVMLMVAPLFHLAGLSVMLRAISRGASVVVLPAFTPDAMFQAIQQHRVTSTFAVPVMLQLLADHPKAAEVDLSTVTFMGYGASPISEPLLERAFKLFPNAEFFQGYGMTELVCSVSNLLAKHHGPEGRKAGLLRTAGRALPGIEVRVVDADDRDVPTGQPGELIVRSPSMMTGYWNRPEDTAIAMRGGWMHTGDAATLDAKGFITIVDRIKDMIVTGGENVYCAEVENAVARHPAVAAVAVIGVPSKEWGETVHAVVVAKPGATLTLEQLQEHCKTLIAGYKCPRSLELLPALPVSAAGKVLKYQLREPHWQGHSRRVS